jgi:hypothetical protein
VFGLKKFGFFAKSSLVFFKGMSSGLPFISKNDGFSIEPPCQNMNMLFFLHRFDGCRRRIELKKYPIILFISSMFNSN